jgi:hypothetical protein
VATATWGRQTEASIQWGDNQFRFIEVPEKTPIFIFSQKICRPLKSAALGGRLVRLMVKPPLFRWAYVHEIKQLSLFARRFLNIS